MLRPSMGEQIPTDPEEIAKAFGTGWWKPDPQAAQRTAREGRLQASAAAQWMTPDGKPFTIRIMVEGDVRPVMTRAGTHDRAAMAAVRHRRQDRRRAGHAARRGAPPAISTAFIGWSVETWGGHPDLSFFLDSWHSQFVAAAGQAAAAAQLAALVQSRSSTRSSSRSAPSASTIPKGIELGKEYVKLAVREMPTIPLMSYNVFTVMDETYWTGYPNAETAPYTDPVPNWGNSRYMMVKLKPAS